MRSSIRGNTVAAKSRRPSQVKKSYVTGASPSRVRTRIDPSLARMCALRELGPGRSRRADQRRVRFAQSHCHSPNFRIAGSHDIRAVIESRQCAIFKNASYTAACDAICHMDVSAHGE